jgi:hypothetical protein
MEHPGLEVRDVNGGRLPMAVAQGTKLAANLICRHITTTLFLLVVVGGDANAAHPVAAGVPTLQTRPQTPNESTIWAFLGTPDGAIPRGALVTVDNLRRGNDAIYGTTTGGGARNLGVVFDVEPPQTSGSRPEHVLHSFGGAPDGANPYGGVTIGKRNPVELFGTTANGGSTGCANGCGTVFSLIRTTRSGNFREHVLYRFQGGSDGSYPDDKPLVDASGTMFGTT